MASRKPYTKVEDDFLKCCVQLADEKGINNADLARAISPLVDRTFHALQQKFSTIRSELANEQQEKQEEAQQESQQEEEHTLVQNIKSETQIIQAHEPDIITEYFGSEDVGRVIDVVVVNLKEYGAFCREVGGTKSGLMLKGMMSTNFVDKIIDYVQIGDEFKVLVVKDNKLENRVLLNAKIVGSIIPIKDRK